MRFRLVALVICVLLTCSWVTAQPNNCCGIDRQCATDQEWNDGYWAYQNNQCQSSSQPQQSTQPSQDVDNCCFVDRQCTTDEDWASGYWAFQNNQCNAPAQSSMQDEQQPAMQDQPQQTQGEIDNYCFTIWTCVTEEDWVRGYNAYQNNLGSDNPLSGGTEQPATNATGPSGGQTFYEVFGHQTMTSDAMLLTRGNWNLTLTTAAQSIVNIGSVDIPGCLSHSTHWVSGWATRFQSVQALAWKTHNRLGGDGEARGQITVHRDCNVSFYVYAPLHPWSLKLSKS